ncbi:MAG: hypothetical protein R3314_02575 [Longimicrobiales bacterium]|nr:hypothetical protein [Longimicrobiales bacterium]
MSANETNGDTNVPHRPTGMGEPGELPSDRPDRVAGRAREAVGDKLEETAGRVRELGDRAAARTRALAPTRPFAYDAARSIDHAADYVRTRELEGMKTDLEVQVRRHPLAAVAVAFVAGYAFRRIFS